MNCLVDIHILMWSFFEPQRLSETIREIITDTSNEIYFSPVSLWEISIKYALGKLKLNGLTPEEFYHELNGSFYRCKEIDSLTIIVMILIRRKAKTILREGGIEITGGKVDLVKILRENDD